MLDPPIIGHTLGRGITIDFALGSSGLEVFEQAMARIQEAFPDKGRTVPIFEATPLGVYLPGGWDSDV